MNSCSNGDGRPVYSSLSKVLCKECFAVLDGQMRALLPSPPAPPRSEQEITWAHVVSGCDHLNPSIREHDGRMMETLGACSKCIASALEGAARDAAKKERERVLDEVRLSTCFMCADDDEYNDETEQHRVKNEFRDDYVLCRSKHIRRALKRYRALPPEEGPNG